VPCPRRFPKQPHDLSPRLRMSRQEVDEVGPAIAPLVAEAGRRNAQTDANRPAHIGEDPTHVDRDRRARSDRGSCLHSATTTHHDAQADGADELNEAKMRTCEGCYCNTDWLKLTETVLRA
jgi:hypothetical protein